MLFRHAVHPFQQPHASKWEFFGWDLFTPMLNGWMGVDLFFVLSGFLVTFLLMRRASSPRHAQPVREYLLKRVLRIVPAYYCVLLIVAAGLVPGYEIPAPPETLKTQLGIHLLFLQDYFPGQIVVAFWSLGVEEKFYLLIPLAVIPMLGMPFKKRLRWLLVLTAIPVCFRIVTWFKNPWIDTYPECFWTMRSPFHLAADSLLVGTICAILYAERENLTCLQSRWLPRVAFFLGGAIIAVCLLATPLLSRINFFTAVLLMPLLAAGFGAILFGLVLGETGVNRLFCGPVLFFFSKISYTLYLVHIVFVESLYRGVSNLSFFDSLSVGQQFLLYFSAFASVSIFAALLIHYSVEKPFLILKNRIGDFGFLSRDARPKCTELLSEPTGNSELTYESETQTGRIR